MGRKKSNRPVRTRPLPTIPRIFDCPRCEATAIRISLQSDIALVECGNCLLKQTITNIKQIEEPIDIFGNFVDEYYKNLELHESSIVESVSTVEGMSSSEPHMVENPLAENESEHVKIESEEISTELTEADNEEVEKEEEEPAPIGFVPRTKGDVLKKKNKEKENKKKKLSLS